MTGLELHTLNQVGPEAAVRAGDGAPVTIWQSLAAEKSPGTTGDFSFPVLDAVQSSAMTIVPDFLKPVDAQRELLGTLRESELLGDLMREVRLSKLTGCFMRPEAARNHNGYSRVKSAAAKEVGVGSYRDAHRVAHFLFAVEQSGELPSEEDLHKTVDHICRNPSCCNPVHTRLMSSNDNNVLKDKAKKLEPTIIKGQAFFWRDIQHNLPWLEHAVIENEGDVPEKVISTRLGHFALLYVSEDSSWVMGTRLSDDVYDGLRPLGKNNYFATSRAKGFKPVENNQTIFHPRKFKKKKRSTQKELYEAA
ncbi:HNH endonuclease [Candidatus Saccharibacteria bacterium]|nr:HNH endonuclease [Candidatus Saccharibacteria bacterium]